jgi:hypothetical protein
MASLPRGAGQGVFWWNALDVVNAFLVGRGP